MDYDSDSASSLHSGDDTEKDVMPSDDAESAADAGSSCDSEHVQPVVVAHPGPAPVALVPLATVFLPTMVFAASVLHAELCSVRVVPARWLSANCDSISAFG